MSINTAFRAWILLLLVLLVYLASLYYANVEHGVEGATNGLFALVLPYFTQFRLVLLFIFVLQDVGTFSQRAVTRLKLDGLSGARLADHCLRQLTLRAVGFSAIFPVTILICYAFFAANFEAFTSLGVWLFTLKVWLNMACLMLVLSLVMAGLSQLLSRYTIMAIVVGYLVIDAKVAIMFKELPPVWVNLLLYRQVAYLEQEYLVWGSVGLILLVMLAHLMVLVVADIKLEQLIGRAGRWPIMVLGTVMVVSLVFRPYDYFPADMILPKQTAVGLNTSRYLVINYWASWCGPCVAEMPQLATLADTIDPSKARIVALSQDKDPAATTKTLLQHPDWESKGIQFAAVPGSVRHHNAYLSLLEGQFEGVAIPFTLVTEGRQVRYYHVGFLPGSEIAVAKWLRSNPNKQ